VPRYPGVDCCRNGPGNAYETPNRDRLHGRMYRISYDSAKAAPPMRLDNATPAQLVRALSNDNMFWRMTAQRLLVERAKTDVVPALVQLVNDHTIDSLGLNSPALHALWTLHGLGAFSDQSVVTAARHALHHPASAVRRAAIMTLPHDQQLVDDIFAAGILPDRSSPWKVDYTVATSILQDADAHVRLEALLVLSEMPSSPRIATALADIIASPDNARDPWIPDAVAMSGVKQGPEFVSELLRRRAPNDSAAAAGLGRSIQRMVRYHAARRDIGVIVGYIETVPQSSPAVAVGILNGIAEGWPLEAAPTLTVEQKAKLVTAARNASPPVAAAFGRIATRWNLPNAFRPE
jgi:hypothetical protein